MIILPVELYSSKNGQQIIYSKKRQHLMVIKKAVARQQEYTLNTLLLANKRTWDKMVEGKQFPLYVCIYIYRQTNRRSDVNNICQGLFDAMTRAGYIQDDCWKYFIPIYVGVGVDKHNPRVLIWIYDDSKTLIEQFIYETEKNKT